MLILASNSPRRRQLLAWFGVDFVVQTADIDESRLPGETPQIYTTRVAAEKAWKIAAGRDQQDIILAADTTVAMQSPEDKKWKILGKPADEDEAQAMLRILRGKTHQVFTGVAVTYGQRKAINGNTQRVEIKKLDETQIHSALSVTDVLMRVYSDQEMLDYIKSGDPLDKAGASALQHKGFHPVESLTECFTSVVGLPVCLVDTMLRKEGIIPQLTLPDSCRSSQNSGCEVFRQIFPD